MDGFSHRVHSLLENPFFEVERNQEPLKSKLKHQKMNKSMMKSKLALYVICVFLCWVVGRRRFVARIGIIINLVLFVSVFE